MEQGAKIGLTIDVPDDMTFSRHSSTFEEYSDRDDRDCFEKSLTSIIEDKSQESDCSASTAIQIFESQSCLFAKGDEIDQKISLVFDEFQYYLRAFALTDAIGEISRPKASEMY